MREEEIKKMVREAYANIARGESSCCDVASDCCTSSSPETITRRIGYGEEELAEVGEEADMGLGCGNPVELADLNAGEIVLDLGSGGGLDCLLAAKEVGEAGRVIGVDMTPEMIDRARRNARKGQFTNVDFRIGEIDHLPVADASVDVILSNCVINLVPDKARVFQEAFRVLKPGGRFVISDIVLAAEAPLWILSSVKAYTGCLSGAMQKKTYLETIRSAGFQGVAILKSSTFPIDCMANDPTAQALMRDKAISAEKLKEFLKTVESITVTGHKS